MQQRDRWFGFAGYDGQGKKLPALRVWHHNMDAARSHMATSYPNAEWLFVVDLSETTFGASLAPGTRIGQEEEDGFWTTPNWPG